MEHTPSKTEFCVYRLHIFRGHTLCILRSDTLEETRYFGTLNPLVQCVLVGFCLTAVMSLAAARTPSHILLRDQSGTTGVYVSVCMCTWACCSRVSSSCCIGTMRSEPRPGPFRRNCSCQSNLRGSTVNKVWHPLHRGPVMKPQNRPHLFSPQ